MTYYFAIQSCHNNLDAIRIINNKKICIYILIKNKYTYNIILLLLVAKPYAILVYKN